MEIVGDDGSKIVLTGAKTVFGRGSGFASNDRTVSRRHILFQSKASDDGDDGQTDPFVSFEVIGRNPIFVQSDDYGKIRVFKVSEKGEMEVGDSFCVAGKTPVWFNLRTAAKSEAEESRITETGDGAAESLGSGADMDDVDVSGIDPIKEFGFLVMGHEFDNYNHRMIRDVKKWHWFLEEPGKDSDEDEDFGKRERKSMSWKKRKKGVRNDDDDEEDWTGESGDEKETIARVTKFQRPKYSTRSRDANKPHKNAEGNNSTDRKKAVYSDENDDDEETLGGFIVPGDEVDYEDENGGDEVEEEEEEFLDDDEEEDVED